MFGGWPEHWTGPLALVPDGLLGFFVGPHPAHEVYHLHGLQLISWNLFVVAGLVMLAVAAGRAARAAARRAGAGPARPPKCPRPADNSYPVCRWPHRAEALRAIGTSMAGKDADGTGRAGSG